MLSSFGGFIPFDRKLHYLQIIITYIFRGTKGITDEDIKDVIDRAMSGSPAEAVMTGLEKKFNLRV